MGRGRRAISSAGHGGPPQSNTLGGSRSMAYETIFRTEKGQLRLPYGSLSLLLRFHEVPISSVERPAVENMTQFLSSAMILAARLRSHLSRYEEKSWVNVPFDELFLDTQSVLLFFRQFIEDIAFVMRAVLPKPVRAQMPAGFTDLVARILASDTTCDSALDAVIPASDPLRQFLAKEQEWFAKVKDLRDDICHRSAYGQLRTAKFPGLIDLISSAGGKAAFASEADLRSYLRGLFQRWLAFACLSSDFIRRRIVEEHPTPAIPYADGFIVRAGEIDFTKTSKEPLFPPGTTIMSVSAERLEALEYFVSG